MKKITWLRLTPEYPDFRQDDRLGPKPVHIKVANRPTEPRDVVSIERTEDGYEIRHLEPREDFEIMRHAVASACWVDPEVEKAWEEAKKSREVERLLQKRKVLIRKLEDLNYAWIDKAKEGQTKGLSKVHTSMIKIESERKEVSEQLKSVAEALVSLGAKIPVDEKPQPAKTPEIQGAATVQFATSWNNDATKMEWKEWYQLPQLKSMLEAKLGSAGVQVKELQIVDSKVFLVLEGIKLP